MFKLQTVDWMILSFCVIMLVGVVTHYVGAWTLDAANEIATQIGQSNDY